MADTNKPAENGINLNINLDNTPVFYTDNIFMYTNNFGLVLDVGQKLGNTNQVRVVTRIGMSREHAKRFVEELGKLLVMTEGNMTTGEKVKN